MPIHKFIYVYTHMYVYICIHNIYIYRCMCIGEHVRRRICSVLPSFQPPWAPEPALAHPPGGDPAVGRAPGCHSAPSGAPGCRASGSRGPLRWDIYSACSRICTFIIHVCRYIYIYVDTDYIRPS